MEERTSEYDIQPKINGADSQTELLREFLNSQQEALSRLINAYANTKERAPRYSLWNAALAYGAVLVILVALVVLAWSGKIASEVLTFALGLIVGVIAYHLRAVFPLKG